MPDPSPKRKQFLFVDDDPEFLASIRDIFTELAHGTWEIHLAQNHSQALSQLQKQKMDLIVVDIGMPVVDGVQFLRLLNRAHPGQQIAMLTGLGAEERRKECLENGALLILEKPSGAGGYDSIFAALDALAGAAATEGFRGMMRRVGLQEVLQMECLGAKSSILEIFTGKTHGRIYIRDGAIVHAAKGNVEGELALYSLLALRGGEFNLRPFEEPPRRTIQGQWEFLLMEAARLIDEAGAGEESTAAETEPAPETRAGLPVSASGTEDSPQKLAPEGPREVRIEEVVLCSGAGEVLYDWQCKSRGSRVKLLAQIEEQATQLSATAPVGRLERLEIQTELDRMICQILPDRRLFVRSTGGAR